MIMPYKIDTDNDENIMLIHISRILIPKATKEQLVAAKNRSIVLKAYEKTIIQQLHICDVTVNHKKKQKLSRFL